ncbi:hypothetical protein [Mycolicibacterium rutilum]|uniref:hypothetical protein n=1 Tax=Mycolicibacterium rutilum TaxID=370526 RepID=UPI0012FFB638|nr:hypothetical protein [Mycolicibacterium rutilum]
MLTRFKAVIGVDPFVHAVEHSVRRGEQLPARLEVAFIRPRKYQQPVVDDAPWRTAPYPKGDRFGMVERLSDAVRRLKGIAQYRRRDGRERWWLPNRCRGVFAPSSNAGVNFGRGDVSCALT